MTTPPPSSRTRCGGWRPGMLLLSGIVLGRLVGLAIGALVGATALRCWAVGFVLGFAVEWRL